MADFAITQGVHAILAPTHFIENMSDPWLTADLHLCEALRVELDRVGGSKIEIDYPLITTSALLRDEEARGALTNDLHSLPVHNVWLRVSGFGADATGAGIRLYIETVRSLHQIQRPLVADSAGGLAALATGAFGAVGAICHGVSQKENFRSSDWRKPPSRKGGGSAVRIYVAELDRHLTEAQLDALFAARHGRSRFACNDTTCCPNGREDMIENAHAHFLTQRYSQIENLSKVPKARRAEHFLLHYLDPAVRSARFGATLNISDLQVAKVIGEAKSRLVRLRDALADLHAIDTEEVSCSPTPSVRGPAQAINAVRR